MSATPADEPAKAKGKKAVRLVFTEQRGDATDNGPIRVPRGVRVPTGRNNGNGHRYPTMPADQFSYYSRSHYPLALEHFTIPQYMRTLACRVNDEDEANSGLELYVRIHRHLDITAAFGQGHFHMPFALVPPENIRLGDGPTRTTIDFVVEEMLANTNAEKFVGTTPNGDDAHEVKKRGLRNFYTNSLLEGCMAMRDPRELAAAALVGFQLFNPFNDAATAMRAGAFVANGILLAEGMPPLSADDITSPVLNLAVQKDADEWFNKENSTDLTPATTTAYIKTIEAKCHACERPGKRCLRCRGAFFCGEVCLRRDYIKNPESDYVPRHTEFCKRNAVAKREAKAAAAAKQGQ